MVGLAYFYHWRKRSHCRCTRFTHDRLHRQSLHADSGSRSHSAFPAGDNAGNGKFSDARDPQTCHTRGIDPRGDRFNNGCRRDVRGAEARYCLMSEETKTDKLVAVVKSGFSF